MDSRDRCRFWLGILMLMVVMASQAPHLVSSCPSVAAQRAADPSLSPLMLCRPWLTWRPGPLAPPLSWSLLWLLAIGWMATPRLRRWGATAQEQIAEIRPIGYLPATMLAMMRRSPSHHEETH